MPQSRVGRLPAFLLRNVRTPPAVWQGKVVADPPLEQQKESEMNIELSTTSFTVSDLSADASTVMVNAQTGLDHSVTSVTLIQET